MRTPSFAAFCKMIVLCGALALVGCSSPQSAIQVSRAAYDSVLADQVLKDLREDINGRYGFRDGAPRINLGPCGRFARDFRERWNTRFREPVTVAFLMSTRDASNCYHVLVRLPDGRYYDGGNGVVTRQFLMTLYSEMRIEEMKEFNYALLDKRSYGLGRSYPECPNYSDEFTQRTIETRLAELLKPVRP